LAGVITHNYIDQDMSEVESARTKQRRHNETKRATNFGTAELFHIFFDRIVSFLFRQSNHVNIISNILPPSPPSLILQGSSPDLENVLQRAPVLPDENQCPADSHHFISRRPHAHSNVLSESNHYTNEVHETHKRH
jgi:hypothetical protein